MINIIISPKNFREETSEFVERKGVGHPDTLSDTLAEKLPLIDPNKDLDIHYNISFQNCCLMTLLWE